MSTQGDLWTDRFQTAQPANPLYCHEDFLDKLSANQSQPLAKRASLLLQRLAVDEQRVHFKATKGANKGWRRSRLGGNQGSHFYLWWAPGGSAPLKEGTGFENAPRSSIVLRDIRHHDDHTPLPAQSFGAHYLPVSVLDLRCEEYAPAPWTAPQSKFAGARHMVRILKGHPGSGKTTALLHAADACGARKVLYITYSRDLTTLARQYFDRFCSDAKQFHVVTFQTFLREFVRSDLEQPSLATLRARFRNDMVNHARAIGAWGDLLPALYDELHAHFVGGALPVDAGRFGAARDGRSTERNYRQRRMGPLGQTNCNAALDAAARLERGSTNILEQYFPDLYLAWLAGAALVKGGDGLAPQFFDFDCIAVDETQDLTALDCFVISELAAVIGRQRSKPIHVLFAGDEAQTVRPTDFEWGWLSDILHNRLATPTEFKLQVNLRSPKRLATLVNRVWDLYAEVEKRDRPSGSGYAEIEDDAADQLLYCSAAPGDELVALLRDLSNREGLALIALDDGTLQAVPEAFRPLVLTAAEAKGLDFHSVCVLDAGKHLVRIQDYQDPRRAASAPIESLRKRLAIDQFRVALSRPAERLIWLDVNPSAKVVSASTEFLNRTQNIGTVSPTIPAAILQTLGEEELDTEERIQRCLNDARQLLDIKPDISWSRAQMAVTLLGTSDMPGAVADEALRKQTFRTLAEVCFALALRGARLSPELGHPKLLHEAQRGAMYSDRPEVTSLIMLVERALTSRPEERLNAMVDFARMAKGLGPNIPAWVLTELRPRLPLWADEMERAVAWGDNAEIIVPVLPGFYDAVQLSDAAARKKRLHERAIQSLVKNKRFAQALRILEQLPDRDHKLEAHCLEELGNLAEAAARYKLAGDMKSALHCYRKVPDFASAYALIKEIKDHPAAESYEWIMQMRQLIAKRPEKFTRIIQPSEKLLLEKMLEEAMGAQRKKPAAKRATAKRASTRRAARIDDPF